VKKTNLQKDRRRLLPPANNGSELITFTNLGLHLEIEHEDRNV
jgi:hypothetical protein